MRWDHVAPEGLADELRRHLLWAFADAWAANVQRHRPEELGDSALNFGLNVTTNARFLAALELREFDGVVEREQGQLRWLEISNGETVHRVYIYKAPPGASSIADVSFNDSKIKDELTTANARQLSLPIDGAGATLGASNIVIVMFGDTISGFERAVVGAPYRRLKRDGGRVIKTVAWEWDESFGGADDAARRGRDATPIAPAAVDDDLPVRLRPVADIGETG